MNLNEIKQVKESADIVEVIGHFLDIKPKQNNYVSKCPFHEEKSMSFTVNRNKNIFKCFGCGIAGDSIDFVMKVKSFNYRQATEWIADLQNIHIDKEYIYIPEPEKPISFLPISIIKPFKMPNNFMSWLQSVFPNHKELVYSISTSGYWDGAVCFWYIDVDYNVRSGKIMQYNPLNGKRIKDPQPLVTWVHKALRIPDYNMEICLFGEHLIKRYPKHKICIVESEKTAIVASIAYPGFLWIASGSLTNLTFKRCQVLEGREVILYPDVGAEERWTEKMEQLKQLLPSVKWSLRPCDSKIKGYDLCDFIIDKLKV